MGQIVSKLNLNQLPSIVENNSLIFAKNIRVDVDGSLHKDYDIYTLTGKYPHEQTVLEQIYWEFRTKREEFDKQNNNNYERQVYKHFEDIIGCINTKYDYDETKEELEANGETLNPDTDVFQDIVGVIADSNDFYLFIKGYFTPKKEVNGVITKRYVDSGSLIVRYSEKDKCFYPCDCSWKYSGGTISGHVTTNLIGDKILCIGEQVDSDILVPFKCINLNKSKYTDDESIYTQTPKIPLTNLDLVGRFAYTIPNGVYQFFVRYKIRDNFYSNWFPASKECFAGNKNSRVTNFGTLTYNNTKRASDSSFIFEIHHLISTATNNYKNFQIGFICSHDDGIYARAWKHFDFTQSIINFDYNSVDAEEIEVTDLLKVNYQIYNVGNVTSFKNKLYISNYKETDFNKDLQKYADDIIVTTGTKPASEGYGGYPVTQITVNGKTYIKTIASKNISGEYGIINEVLGTSKSQYLSVKECFRNITNNSYIRGWSKAYNIEASINIMPLTTAKNNIIKGTDEIVEGPTYPNGDTISYVSINKTIIKTSNINDVISHIYNKGKYINEDGLFVDANKNTVSQFDIKIYRDYTLEKRIKVPNGVIGNNNDLIINTKNNPPSFTQNSILDGGYHYEERTVKSTYAQDVTVRLYADKALLNTTNTDDLVDYTTLIPYQKYKFYVHYITANGEITNGYYCKCGNNIELEVPYRENCDTVIYPVFKNIIIPDGYVACFFSIFHCAINSSTIFNLTQVNNINGTKVGYEGYCPDMNCMLVPAVDNIVCRQTTTSGIREELGTFYYSDSNIQRYFGACGMLLLDSSTNLNTANNVYAITNYESKQDDDIELIKCTPFITTSMLDGNEFKDYKNLNLGGYICTMSMLDKERTTKYYTDGASVYQKVDNLNVLPLADGNTFKFTELSNYLDTSPSIVNIASLKPTTRYNFYSRYNLNYVSLGGDGIKEKVATYYAYQDPGDREQVTYSVMLLLISSATCSDIYQLESMYKSYIRKTYLPYNTDTYGNNYDNTIRSSIAEGDESEFNIFRFDATDYYNVPANRGKIVNLVAVGDSILCHTEDSMFKFTGSNSLQSSEGEITSVESTPFDTGISEMFGSDFGFAGLQNKNHCCITENGYIFYDSHANIIYMYSGNGQIVKLSDSIKKLLKYDTVIDVFFANDYYHDRFFTSIHYSNGKKVTLSFSLLENIKSFISLHDFYFSVAFNTKTNCYFLSNIGKRWLFKVDDKRIVRTYASLTLYKNEENLYPCEITGIWPDQILSSIVDIIDNSNIESIKTLNYINWCCDSDTDYLNENNSIGLTNKLMSQHKDNNIDMDMVIYTDTCNSGKINCKLRSNDSKLKDDLTNYKRPRYNQGLWSLNYFRNIENTNNKNNSDNKSLIEGRYFVVRFIFRDDFKLETLSCNTNIKI